MTVRTFDRAAGIVLAFVFGFSLGVAVTSWHWFPSGYLWHVAEIPPGMLNYSALLLPWLSLLAYLLGRRLWLGEASS